MHCQFYNNILMTRPLHRLTFPTPAVILAEMLSLRYQIVAACAYVTWFIALLTKKFLVAEYHRYDSACVSPTEESGKSINTILNKSCHYPT